MKITIIADASYCHETQAGGYAFWIACGRGSRGGDGQFKEPVPSSGCAELMALVNALHFGTKEGLIREGDTVLMQSDCTGALHAMEGRRDIRCNIEQSVFQYYKNLKNQFKLVVIVKHVKGHTNNRDARSTANYVCDKLARANMRKARGIAHCKKILRSIENDN